MNQVEEELVKWWSIMTLIGYICYETECVLDLVLANMNTIATEVAVGAE